MVSWGPLMSPGVPGALPLLFPLSVPEKRWKKKLEMLHLCRLDNRRAGRQAPFALHLGSCPWTCWQHGENCHASFTRNVVNNKYCDPHRFLMAFHSGFVMRSFLVGFVMASAFTISVVGACDRMYIRAAIRQITIRSEYSHELDALNATND